MNDQTNNKTFKNKSYYINMLKQRISNYIHSKCPMSSTIYSINLTNSIIFNVKSRLVTAFKDLLIFDDESDFLKRYYTTKESMQRLPRFYDYYTTFSKIYPNYTTLFESKYIYKNIHKKQKMIDLQQEQESILNKNSSNENNNNNKTNEVFSTNIYNSIVNDNDDIALIFDLKHDSDNINEEMSIIIDKISNAAKKLHNKATTINSSSNATGNNSINSDGQHWKSILIQRPSYFPAKMPIKVIPHKRQNYSSKRICEKSLFEYKQNISYRRNGHNLLKVSNNNNYNNDKSKHSNLSASPQMKYNNSVTMSHQKNALVNNNIDNSTIVKKQETPLTQRQTSKILNRNDFEKSDLPEKIKVNIRNNVESDSMKMKNDIITQMQNANNTYYFQARAIADKIKLNVKLATQNKPKEHIISPPVTTRKIIYNQLKGTSNKNSNNNSKQIIKQNTTPIKTNTERPQYHKKEIEVLRKSKVYNYNKQSYSHNTSNRSISKASSKEKNKREPVTMKAVRAKSRIDYKYNQNEIMQYSNSNNEEKKEISSCQISIISPSFNKSPIKQKVKGIQIKNFNKLLSIVEKVTNKPTKKGSTTERNHFTTQRNYTNNIWHPNDKFNEIVKQNV